MRRRNFRTPWMIGLIMAEELNKEGGLPAMMEWWRGYDADYYFQNCYELYSGFHAYLKHVGAV